MSMMVDTPKKVYELFEEGVPITGTIAGWRDLGVVPTKFGPKAKVLVKIYTGLKDGEGDDQTAIASFTKNLHEKSSLRAFLKSVIGRDPGEQYDVLLTIGKSNDYVFSTSTGAGGKQYSNISAVLRATKKLPIPADFVCFNEEQAAKPATKRQVATPVPDEDVVEEV
jgi:hypothetical protein